jgi:hypothetical protein
MHEAQARLEDSPRRRRPIDHERVVTMDGERDLASVLETVDAATPRGCAFVIHVPPGASTESPPRRDGMLDAMGRIFEWRGGLAVRVDGGPTSTPHSVFSRPTNFVVPEWRTLPRHGIPPALLARNLWARACQLTDRPILVLLSNADHLVAKDRGETIHTLSAIAQLPRSRLRGIALDATAAFAPAPSRTTLWRVIPPTDPADTCAYDSSQAERWPT